MNNILFELVDMSLLVLDLVSETTQLFGMNFSVVLHLFLQGSLQNTAGTVLLQMSLKMVDHTPFSVF